MTIRDAVATLRAHNEWRRYDGSLGKGPEMGEPKQIGIAIDTVCDALEATNQRAIELTWQDVKRIVNIADDILKVEHYTNDEGLILCRLPEYCDTEEHYYGEILKRFNNGIQENTK